MKEVVLEKLIEKKINKILLNRDQLAQDIKDEKYEKFARFCCGGDLARVQKYVNCGYIDKSDLNYSNYYFTNIAARDGRGEILEYLMNLGDYNDEMLSSALYHATMQSRPEIIRRLIKMGAHPESLKGDFAYKFLMEYLGKK